ncbi:DUF350 domain-containing protein [Bacillus sp. FJAT-44742]|uniref:DUF350 domain-containing protein n=1 Tax=Bacillus sp. FJAT-44742 TaxID=2014005 RepID=UPI000C23FFE1|nr:DUF350 domain-containing protein [Bacillus sp. FJAT-44742]
MEELFENPFIQTAGQYSVAVLALIVCLTIFEFLTPYKNWEEIKAGNMAVALATGGKIFGVANIFHFSILHNDSILVMLVWGAFGFALLMLGYMIFEFLTPMFKVDEEIENGNKAVGFIAFVLSTGLSFVIGGGINSM